MQTSNHLPLKLLPQLKMEVVIQKQSVTLPQASEACKQLHIIFVRYSYLDCLKVLC